MISSSLCVDDPSIDDGISSFFFFQKRIECALQNVHNFQLLNDFIIETHSSFRVLGKSLNTHR